MTDLGLEPQDIKGKSSLRWRRTGHTQEGLRSPNWGSEVSGEDGRQWVEGALSVSQLSVVPPQHCPPGFLKQLQVKLLSNGRGTESTRCKVKMKDSKITQNLNQRKVEHIRGSPDMVLLETPASSSLLYRVAEFW